MARALEGPGIEIFSAKDGEEGFKLFCEHLPDLVISDIQMPIKNGYELCAEIRATKEGRITPILAMTGSDGFESIEKSYDVGATDFISKPINYQLMVNRVRYILRSHQTFLDLKSSQGKLESLGRVLDNSVSEIYFLDGETCLITSVNKSVLQNVGYNLEELYGLKLSDIFVSELDFDHSFGRVRAAIKSGQTGSFHCRSKIRRKDGSIYPVEGDVYTSKGGAGASLVCLFEDITQREIDQQKMRQLAYYDSLTKLPNRELFFENFKQALTLGKKQGERIGLLFVDLDDFKHINDTLGHRAGDELLGKIAETLEGCIRDSGIVDGAFEESLARFGGDEFAILVRGLKSDQDVTQLADNIVKTLAAPCLIRGREIVTTPSIGIVTFPEHGSDPDLLLQRADVAMYEAKKRGKCGYQIYSDSLYAESLERIELERDLRLATAKKEFQLYYQPKYIVADKTISGFEALIRWNREGTPVSPGLFIPLAEESNLILDIGRWVFGEVCRQIRVWFDEGAGQNLRIAVNLSTKQFSDPELVSYILSSLKEYDIPASCLELEVTETVLMSDLDVVSETLRQLKELGFSIALDDFGTGYSSLSYLNRFPLDVLKIDKSFVDKINVDSNNSIISAIVALSNELGLRVVAEGVETEGQLKFLRQLGVDYLQGYIWGKPVPAEKVKALILNSSICMSN